MSVPKVFSYPPPGSEKVMHANHSYEVVEVRTGLGLIRRYELRLGVRRLASYTERGGAQAAADELNRVCAEGSKILAAALERLAACEAGNEAHQRQLADVQQKLNWALERENSLRGQRDAAEKREGHLAQLLRGLRDTINSAGV